MRTFEIPRGAGTKLEGVVYSDGSIAVRRIAADPCERITFNFEGLSECEAELGIEVPQATESMRAREAAPLGVYAGDGHPLARYAAADNGPEPEDVET